MSKSIKEIEKIQKEFVELWPLEKVRKMTLKEYGDFSNKDGFIYGLEFGTSEYLGIGGSTAFKFCIYKYVNKPKLNKGKECDEEYAWSNKYGTNRADVFKNIKSRIIKVIEYSILNKKEDIEQIDLPQAMKWKVAILYNPTNYIRIVNKDALIQVARRRGLRDADSKKYFELQNYFIDNKPKNENYIEYSDKIWDESQLNPDKEDEIIDPVIEKNDCYLLTWNSKKGQFVEEITDIKKLLQKGKPYYETWSVISNSISENDRVFLMHVGSEPRGIMGSGKAVISDDENIEFVNDYSAVFYGDHWDEEKFRKGEKAKYIFVEWDTIFDKNNDKILSIDILKERFPNQNWTPQGSGIKINEEYINELTDLWNNFLENDGTIKRIPPKRAIIMRQNLNTILYGPPGTGKTYSTFDKAVEIVANDEYIANDHEHNVGIFRKELDKKIFFLTFHQNYCYEEFVGGLRPVESAGNLQFEWKPGVFLRACAAAYNESADVDGFLKACDSTDLLNEGKYSRDNNVVLIIDEINRANISRVFGELITLIESDKRIGEKHELILTLPGGKKFGVPNNLYILGTMNTADKSIAHIDIALRRRFKFEPLYPNLELIDDFDKKEFLKIINAKIYNKKKSADNLIGHSYFLNGDDLNDIVRRDILPLLMEYFSGNTDEIKSLFLETKVKVEFNSETFEWLLS